MTVGDFLESPKNRIIIESTTLNNNLFTELGSIRNLDNFIQGIFDDGIGKAGRNVCYRGAFLLCLFYLGIHKYGTSGSQIDGIFCK